MKALHIITPVKNSIDTTLQTIDAIMKSDITVHWDYTIYNDFSTDENTSILEREAEKRGFTLVNLKDLTDHPSPNYDLVLQLAQKRALAEEAGILIIESDVTVQKDTIQRLFNGTLERGDTGLAASVTVDENGAINYPYEYAVGRENQVIDEDKYFSFCCTLLSPALLSAVDFATLDPKRDWYDVTLSNISKRLGFKNYLYTNLPVWHRPHCSRPWRTLKEKNRLLYYWKKYVTGFNMENKK